MIVDDHAVIRDGLKLIINSEDDLRVEFEAENIADAWKIINNNNNIDLAIIDITLGNENGISLVKSLTKHFPKIKTMILSMHDDLNYVDSAIRAGAMGFILKQEPSTKVIEGIRKIINNEIAVNSKLTTELLSKLRNQNITQKEQNRTMMLNLLTDREHEVFRLIGIGLSNREIAKNLFVSTKTIETHKRNIKEKLSIKESSKLLQLAIKIVRP